MSVVTTVDQIDAQTLTYIPAVIAGMHAAEQSTAAGATKKQAVLDAIQAGAQAGESVQAPQVAAIAGMIDMFASIFKALGVFRHK